MSHPYHTYPLMDQLTAEELEQIKFEIQEQTYIAGQLIMEHGAISDCFQIIVSGQARIFIEQERKIELALLQRGNFFGEMSCLTGNPVSAHVEAIDEVCTINVSRKGMLLLMDNNSEFRSHIIEAMIKRIQSSNDRVLEEHAKSLIIMKQHESKMQDRYDKLIGVSPAIKKLLTDIEERSTRQEHIVIVGEAGTGKMNVATKLHYLSTQGHYPLLTILGEDFDLPTWSTKLRAAKGGTIVVEQAEQLPVDILQQIIASDHQARIVLTSTRLLTLPNLTTIYVPALRDRVEDIPLLAQYFAEKVSANQVEMAISPDALRLLSLFPFLNNNVEELQALIQEAYILSEGRTIYSNHLRFGRACKPGDRPKIGLALGSGSIRGMAHLGILRVLEDEGIPIDMIAGTSVGSLVGGAYAAGMPLEDCIDVLSTLRWGQLIRPTFPLRSFVHNTPLIRFVEHHLGKVNIEDLPIPFAAVASDALTGEGHIMQTGSLAHAISASTAIPAVMRPMQYQGKTLVDGAVVHPVPVALVKSMGADIVIAVNVCNESFAKGTARHFVDSLMNTIDMMSAKMVKEELQLADIILRPDLGYNQISFKDSRMCIAAGEAVTKDVIHQIRQRLA